MQLHFGHLLYIYIIKIWKCTKNVRSDMKNFQGGIRKSSNIARIH